MKSIDQESTEEVEVPESFDFLTSSSNRFRVLSSLGDGPWVAAELRKELGMPRSTFRRVLSELEERGWAEKTSEGYDTTPLGGYVADYFGDCVETMSDVEKLAVFFEHVEFSEVGVEFDTLVDTDITVSESYAPYAPMEHYIDLVEDADEIRNISPVVTDVYAEAYYDAIMENGTEVHNILRTEVARVVGTRHDTNLQEVIEAGDIETYVYDDDFPLGVSVMDDTATIAAFDESGVMRALVKSDDDEVVEWVRDYYEGYREESERLEEYL